MWTRSDLSKEELEAMAQKPCGCRSPRATGTLHGFTCPGCRAAQELRAREADGG